MSHPNIITKLRDAGLTGKVLADLLGLDEPPTLGKAIRCVRPEAHKNGDKNPSLVVFKRGDGARCRACGFGGGLLDLATAQLGLPDRAAAAAELERRYLPEETKKAHGGKWGDPVDVYDYTDEDGNRLYQVCRLERTDEGGKRRKTFRIRRPDPERSGEFIWKLGDARVVPFRLAHILEAIEKGETSYIVEGEKDVLAVEQAGGYATCNHGGAGKWRDAHTKALRGAKCVVIVVDKDKAGRDHARDVALALAPFVDDIKTVEAKEGKDAFDHLAAGHSLDEFVEIELALDTADAADSRAGSGEDGRPTIYITAEIAEVVDLAQAALAASGEEIYQRGGNLVRVRRDTAKRGSGVVRPRLAPTIVLLNAHGMQELFSKSATWKKLDKRSGKWEDALPPRWAVDCFSARVRWRVPLLEGVVEAPTLRPDGTVIDTPGYDEPTALLYEPNAQFPKVPAHPSREDALAATERLLTPFAEFPYVSPIDRAAMLAAILTLAGRPAIAGPTPLFAVMAPTPGTGKSLLVLAIVTLTTGRPPRTLAPSHEDEEFRKLLTTIALEGSPAILYDNADGHFGSHVLAAALTSHEWSERILGVSKSCTVPLRCVSFMTGNNPSFEADIFRRIIPIRLDAKLEQPEDRKFEIPDLLLHLRTHRPALLVDALTVLSAFCGAGRPHHGDSRMGSYESWDDLVRSCVVWLWNLDPCAGRVHLREETDHEREAVRALFAALADAYPNGQSFTSANIVRDSGPRTDLKDALQVLDRAGSDVTDAKVIGYALRKYRGRVYDGLTLMRADAVRQGALWRMVRLESGQLTESRGDRGDRGDDLTGSGEVSPARAGTKGAEAQASMLPPERPADDRDRRDHRTEDDEDGESGGALVEAEI